MANLPTYQTAIHPDWIDFNGHLRDAYYGLILSYATDDLMDRLGMDAAYRERTKNTLYSLELHIYYLREVKQSDALTVTAGIIGADKKRIHAAFSMTCPRLDEPAATAEFMLLHVHQGVEPKGAPFPDDIRARVDALKNLTAAHPALGAASRKIELR
jgi:acyl-CoA thioester hydrolase